MTGVNIMAYSKKKYDDDDGRIVADMSDVERQPLIIPRFDHFHKKDRRDMGRQEEPNEKSEYDVQYTTEERRAIVGGTVAAALLIGGVFIAAIGLLIFLMTRIA